MFGRSGAGKTTLLRLIAGLERPPIGRLYFGESCWQDSERGLFLPPHRRAVGCVFQNGALFEHLNVRGNLNYALRRAPRGGVTFEEAVDWLALDGLLTRMPGELSGGESRRVAIARALVAAPRWLLMDEPLTGLDREARGEILTMLERLRIRLPVPMLYVTHSASQAARLADHVVLLEGGRVQASGAANVVSTRLDLPLARAEDAAAVIDARVAEHDAFYHLTLLNFAGGRLTIPRRPLALGQPLRVRIAARDVSISIGSGGPSSILNVFPARIAAVTELDASRVLIRLDAEGAMLLARITHKSRAALELKEGQRVHAQVKSIALID